MSTNVFWAGYKSNVGVVSIFNNPTANVGGDDPTINPYTHIDRIYFDTRFEYLNIVKEFEFTKTFDIVDAYYPGTSFRINPKTEVLKTEVYRHRLSYIPLGILYDIDTNQAITGTHILQNIENSSIRTISLQVDDEFFTIREKSYVGALPLPSLSKRYKILIFDKSSEPNP